MSQFAQASLQVASRVLEREGCSYESGTIDLSIGEHCLLAVDVRPSADLSEGYDLLKRGEADKVWMFQEGYAHAPSLKQRD